MNIVDSILFRCRINAEQPAICAPGTQFDLVTYAQLEYMINNLTRAILSFGFQPGHVVGILLQDKIFHIALMLALMRVGAVPVSCRGPSLPKELNAAAIVTDTTQPVSGARRVIKSNPEWVRGSADPVVDPTLLRMSGDEPCSIVLTSGTTGVPKGIVLSHRRLIERNAQLDYSFGNRWPQSSRLYCDMGIGSGAALRYTAYMLMHGGLILFYGESPISTVQSINLFKIQNMVTTPQGLQEHVNFYEDSGIDCSLDHIIVGGSSVSKPLLERAWARMSPHIFSDYGTTETGPVACADFREISATPGAVGYILPQATVEIVDEQGRPVPAGAEGTVRVRTPNMVSGYVGQAGVSAPFFSGGWFLSGDYGYVSEDGLLVVTGRSDTRLNVGGDKINPEAVEGVLALFPGIRDAAALGVPNALGIEEVYALVHVDGLLDREALRAHCQARLQVTFVPVRFIAVDSIPRNDMGKIERSRLLELAKSTLA